jgi:hypothetical protein
MRWPKVFRRAILLASVLALEVLANPRSVEAQNCDEPPRVSRAEIREAMRVHGPYSLTSTTTSMLFGSRALLALVRQRERTVPGDTQFVIDHADWFAAHLETAGVPYAEMSASARAGFEHRQDVLGEYGPGVVEEVVDGPPPITSLAVTIAWSDSGGAPSSFSYRDTLSVPRVDVFNDQVIHFKMLEYDSALVFDEVSGISVRPMGFMSALFGLIGKPDLKETRLAFSRDYWQVVRGRVKVFLGISKTGTAFIEPDGNGHERAPADRADLRALTERLRQPVELRYGPPSCQARRRMQPRESGACHDVMGGIRTCPSSPVRR